MRYEKAVFAIKNLGQYPTIYPEEMPSCYLSAAHPPEYAANPASIGRTIKDNASRLKRALCVHPEE